MSATVDLAALRLDVKNAVAASTGGKGLDSLLACLCEVLPGHEFKLVLSRGGWHRSGGLVDREHARVAGSLQAWADAHSNGDVNTLIDRYADAGYFATRWQGTTHFITASTGRSARAFRQIEVEELCEVIDRCLIDPDWQPDDLEEFLDPLDYPRLDPQPVGAPHLQFRRLLDVPALLSEQRARGNTCSSLERLLDDWDRSSAAENARFCHHWALALRESSDRLGERIVSVKPVAADVAREGEALPVTPNPALRGAVLANQLHRFDRARGYPFAWYFHMLCTPDVSFAVAETVLADIAEGFTYLPERDAQVLQAWGESHYAA